MAVSFRFKIYLACLALALFVSSAQGGGLGGTIVPPRVAQPAPAGQGTGEGGEIRRPRVIQPVLSVRIAVIPLLQLLRPTREPSVALDPDDIERGEILAVTSNALEAEEIAAMGQSLGIELKRRRTLRAFGLVVSVLAVPPRMSVEQGLDELRQRLPTVRMDANHLYRPLGDAGARTYASSTIGWGEATADCGRGLRIGLVDSAVDDSHPAFAGRSLIAENFLARGWKESKRDHGTATAALLIGAPSSGFSGLLPGAQLYVASVYREWGTNKVDTTAEKILYALDWLREHSVSVINLSLGGPQNKVLETVIKETLAGGVFVVAAAGNSGPSGPRIYPAAQRGVIAVTAIDSRFRPYRDANQGEYIDLAAPGQDIWTARPGGTSGRYSTLR